ncbi:MAG: LuxR C-terminal-related transcriptional regulator [Saprospiraceae bacterium]
MKGGRPYMLRCKKPLDMTDMEHATTMNNLTSIISSRESEVLLYIAFEFSTKQIASELYVSIETINTHRKNLLKKLGVANSAGLVRRSFEIGILSLSRTQD